MVDTRLLKVGMIPLVPTDLERMEDSLPKMADKNPINITHFLLALICREFAY